MSSFQIWDSNFSEQCCRICNSAITADHPFISLSCMHIVHIWHDKKDNFKRDHSAICPDEGIYQMHVKQLLQFTLYAAAAAADDDDDWFGLV